jgi:hypothetical protein
LIRKGVFRLGFFAALIALWFLESSGFGSVGNLKCQPPSLERTLFSEKSHPMTISGEVPGGAEVILKIVSPNREFKLNKSGKGLGFVWLPIGHAEVRNIPGVYFILSSARIKEILTEEEQRAAGLTCDFQEVYQQAQIVHKEGPGKEEAPGLNREYLSGLIRILKEAGLYKCREGAVKISGGQFEARLIYPADAPLGEYRVFCYAVKDGKAQIFGEGSFWVRSTGLAEWLSRQAYKNALVYGFLAAFIAVGVGLFVGVIFKRGGGH